MHPARPRSRTCSPAAGGFTLIELMIVVSIIGVLASAAIPAFVGYMERSRNVEAVANLEKITSSVKSYYASTGMMPSSSYYDEVLPEYSYGYCWSSRISHITVCDKYGGVYPVAERKQAMSLPYYSCNQLKWQPDGNLRFRYYHYGYSRKNYLYGYARAQRLERCGSKTIEYRVNYRRTQEGGLRTTGLMEKRY